MTKKELKKSILLLSLIYTMKSDGKKMRVSEELLNSRFMFELMKFSGKMNK